MSRLLLLANLLMTFLWHARGLVRSLPCTRAQRKASTMMSTGTTVSSSVHRTFIENIAKSKAPARLDTLMELLVMSGEEIIDPSERNVRDLNPFLMYAPNTRQHSYSIHV